MRFFHLGSSVLSLALVMACADAAAPPPSALEGSWVAAREDASPTGWYQRSLTFGSAGSFTSEFRSYGVYPAQPRDELSGYQRTEGTYEVEGSRLIFHPVRLVEWDRFYGAASPEQITEPYPYTGIFDNARYEMLGPALTLHYTIYPADAPEPAVLVFARAP
jgi:hypothetical protein